MNVREIHAGIARNGLYVPTMLESLLGDPAVKAVVYGFFDGGYSYSPIAGGEESPLTLTPGHSYRVFLREPRGSTWHASVEGPGIRELEIERGRSRGIVRFGFSAERISEGASLIFDRYTDESFVVDWALPVEELVLPVTSRFA